MRVSASAALPAATVYDIEGSPTMCEVSDVLEDDTTVVDDDTSDNDDDDDTSDDDDNGGDDAVFFRATRDIMNRVEQKVGTAAREDRRFCKHFGAPFTIVRMVWDMLVEGGLLPKNGEPKHLLWMLYFLKCYPKEGPGCAAVGGLRSAIDPKTMRKWVWLFLECICELADKVGSLFVSLCLRQMNSHPLLSLLLLSQEITD
jgi:hypothetical protein